jgi:hypothetical protein
VQISAGPPGDSREITSPDPRKFVIRTRRSLIDKLFFGSHVQIPTAPPGDSLGDNFARPSTSCYTDPEKFDRPIRFSHLQIFTGLPGDSSGDNFARLSQSCYTGEEKFDSPYE